MAQRHLGMTTIKYEEVVGKGASQIGFDAGRRGSATSTTRRGCRHHPAPASGAAPALAGGRLNPSIAISKCPAAKCCSRSNATGVLIDSQKLRCAAEPRTGTKMLQLEREAHLKLAGQPFNLNSPKQIQRDPVRETAIAGGQEDARKARRRPMRMCWSNCAEDYPLPKAFLEYRSMAKLKSTYTDKLPLMVNPATGRVHTNYAQAVAVTGRLASSDPNLQNIPVRTPKVGASARHLLPRPATS
jgi:DNA polymerase-1